MALPIYYRNNIYNDEEREKLWLQLLDKGIRYINGIKIDVSKNEEEYFKILETARQQNKRLGFGDNTINWERKKYEQEIRNLKKLKNIGKKEVVNIKIEPTQS